MSPEPSQSDATVAYNDEGQPSRRNDGNETADMVESAQATASFELSADATTELSHAISELAFEEGSEQRTPSKKGRTAVIPGYELLGELGRGAMGVVYRARQVRADRIVAMKIMLNAEHARPTDIARFQTEIESAARLQHPNIVQVYDVGVVNELPYFTQEFIRGGTLSQRTSKQLLPHRETAEIMLELSRAVAYAHAKGIIHRDLKPSNILISEEGVPKIADFGLARRTEDQSHLTRDGTILGTPSYMAPEQASGSIHAVGPLSDVYSLGAILYELLTGRPPFKGATVWEVIHLVRTVDPTSPSELRPDTPKDLETICLKCIQKDPVKRYSSAAELAADLQRHLADEPILARPISRTERALRVCRKYPREVAMAGTLLALIVAIAAGSTWAAWRISHQRDEIAVAKKLSDQRLLLYKDSVSQFVNRAPQLLEGVPLATGIRQELSELTRQLLDSSDAASAGAEASRQWGLGGTAIRKGDLLLAEAELQRRSDSNLASVSEMLTEAEEQFSESQSIVQAVLDRGEGDPGKAMGNLALAISRRAAVKQLANDPVAESLYQKAIELRTQVADLSFSEHPPGQRMGLLGREYSNLASYYLATESLSSATEQSSSTPHKAILTIDQALTWLRKAIESASESDDYFPNLLRDFGVALEIRATLMTQLGAWEEAKQSYSECISVAQRLVELEPLRPAHRTNLLRYSSSFGDFLLVQLQDPVGARAQYVVGMMQLRQLFSDSTLHDLTERGLAMGYYRLGLAAVGMENNELAKKYFQRCELIRDLDLRQQQDLAATRENPDLLISSRIGLALVRAWSGNTNLAIEEARQMIARAQESAPLKTELTRGQLLMHAAAILGIASVGCDEPDRATLLAEGVRTLSMAIDAGYADIDHLRTDPDLAPLRSSEAFESLVAGNEANRPNSQTD